MSETETYDRERKRLFRQINNDPLQREALEAKYGEVWDTKELQETFLVHGFLAPFVTVTRRRDGKKGSLTFQDTPRFYWGFEETS